jgi:hypothetical protein
MIKVYQKYSVRYKGVSYGDCAAACIESILEKPVNLFNFFKMGNDSKDWVQDINDDLKEYGYKLVKVPGYIILKNRYSIDYVNYKYAAHVYVSYNGKKVHDPGDKTLVRIGWYDDPEDAKCYAGTLEKYLNKKQPIFRFYLEKIK